MTEKKIEALFNEAILIGDQLERNLNRFDHSNKAINQIYDQLSTLTEMLKQVSLCNEKIKKHEAHKFSKQIKGQIDRYHHALQEVNLDTSAIESMIEEYKETIENMAVRLDKSATVISQTLAEHGQEFVEAARMIKKGKRNLYGSITIFITGAVIGALFLAVYPIASATKYFHNELLVRDQQIQQLKEQYETNNRFLTFLKKHNIAVESSTTDGSWTKRSFRFSPMILLDQGRVLRVDKINGYTRIIFSKNQNKE